MKTLLVVFTVVVLMCVPSSGQAGETKDGYRVKTVVIDAGHGGHDPGTLGATKVQEKKVSLAVALKLGQYIKDNFPDVKVIFTRSTDEFIELHERASIANRNKADLFISIHCNSSPAPSAYGTEVYVLGLHKTEGNLEVAKRENSVILMEDNYKQQYEGFDPNSPESHIIFSIYQDAYMEQSIKLASHVDDELHKSLKRSSRGVKQAGFLVLWKTTMPSMLIEIGFISNVKEEAFLKSAQGQAQTASAIYRAFKAYKIEMEPGVSHNIKDKGIVSGSSAVTDDDEANDEKDTAETTNIPKKTSQKTVKEKALTKTKALADKAKAPVAKERVVFKVQFMASKVKITPAKEPKLNNIADYEEEHTDYYRYYSGNFDSLQDALNHQAKVRKLGFAEAFVVAFKDGAKVPLKTVSGGK